MMVLVLLFAISATHILKRAIEAERSIITDPQASDIKLLEELTSLSWVKLAGAVHHGRRT